MAAGTQPRLLLPDAPALVAGAARSVLVTPDGEVLVLPNAEMVVALADHPAPMLVHARVTAKRLNIAPIRGVFDLLELLAFALPATTAAPTPRGMALALGMEMPASDEAAAALIPDLAVTILRKLAGARQADRNADAASLAARLRDVARWPWAEAVMAAMGQENARADAGALRVWRRLPEWEDAAPATPAASHPVAAAEARRALADILGAGAEQRPSQSDYASAAAGAFVPREAEGSPAVVLAEAGTGTGKTLGYIAPANLWAERNGAPVWIATYTRNLQRQIEQETNRLFPDPIERRRKIVVRKGRENYLCLLNLEDATKRNDNREALPLALVARWAGATRDGDIQGGDFPGWLAELFDPAQVRGLADRRGECIHSACTHWKRCFVEHSIRRAAGARLVIANHALVMVQAALGGGDDGEGTTPLRYVFDEGHHLFDAADGAFSAALAGWEMIELRRWLLGAEGSGRARGLQRRIEEFCADRPHLADALGAALAAAPRALPPSGWQTRLALADAPHPAEAFLAALRAQVLARAENAEAGYDAECDLHPVQDGLRAAGEALGDALAALHTPLDTLHKSMLALLDEEGAELEVGDRIRIAAAAAGIERRALLPLGAWASMLATLADPAPEPGSRPSFVDWLTLRRAEGKDVDAGMHRHWLDPTIPFATHVAARAHGMLVTSATLRDTAEEDAELAWLAAEARTGASHLPTPAIRASVPSPFDYAAQTRVLVVTDVGAEPAPVAAAMRDLFLASGGGALGLFTAIRRLRAAHGLLAAPLAEAGIPLYAQHVDAMDNGTLVDVFRAEETSCLLGTDALRDGVDVPGRSLRLLVFDRVPWPRPTILHRERRLYLSGGQPARYDDAIARARLRQGFGRLVRAGDDRGVFVLLDRRAPSRVLAGLPVPAERVGLKAACEIVHGFVGGGAAH
ncbi:ATP-dependent DNA helicase [Humitalea sp. 24SJ18S-53]|uniref:ATP-dependent DNA helicase n=1 Tax=Humitalea sp. 24SJ18S-53 TaxID=3422307 RepID=UPI003D66BEA5